jgi:hypothetical protein
MADENIWKQIRDGTETWDSMGGAPRIEKDMNHYSFVWEGRW